MFTFWIDIFPEFFRIWFVLFCNCVLFLLEIISYNFNMNPIIRRSLRRPIVLRRTYSTAAEPNCRLITITSTWHYGCMVTWRLLPEGKFVCSTVMARSLCKKCVYSFCLKYYIIIVIDIYFQRHTIYIILLKFAVTRAYTSLIELTLHFCSNSLNETLNLGLQTQC